jgi:hypothetical protein
MNRLTIPAISLEKEYPSSWEEIAPAHAVRIGEIMYLAFIRQIDYDMARKLAVDEFIQRVNDPNKPAFSEKSLNYWANEAQLAESVKFLFCHETLKDDSEQISINPKFCNQLIPKVKIRGRWYIGPKTLLENLTIFEFKEAGWRVGKFAQTMETRYLDELFAVLYRKSSFFSRERRDAPLSKKEFEESVRLASRLPVGMKFMIYLFFLGCMNWIREETLEIDGQEICFGCLFPKSAAENKSGSPEEGNTGLAGILFQMAESGVFGNMEQTSRVSMWDVFLRLYQIHFQIKQLKNKS